MTLENIKNKIIELCPELKHCGACIDGTKFCGTQYSLCPCHHVPSKWKAECKIELHHVLRAIEKTKNYNKYCLSCDGTFYRSNPGLHHKEITWNLSKDFDGQEDAVKEFIGELLK